MDITGWEEMYRAGERGKEDAATILLVETLEKLPAGTAIDVACGAGRNAIYMAERGWTVTAVDGSEKAIQLLEQRAAAHGVKVQTFVSDLTTSKFVMPSDVFDLVLIAYYLQSDLFAKAKVAVRPGGVVIAIAHIPATGDQWTEKRAAPGELQTFFKEWQILWQYEGASRDPAHKRPVAEIVARRP
jgi:tellurite methyltransferase